MKTATYYSAISKIISCCFLFLAIAITTQAQTRGTVEVIKDPRIDTLAARRLEAAKAGVKPSSGTGAISTDGFRVQFYSGSSRAEATAEQERFQQRYPNVRTYLSYYEPNFKVHAGDFRTRLEATKFMQEIRPVFPTLFIISEKINPPN